MLEEEQIFPELRRPGESSNRLVDVLIDQHRRGRDITRFVIETTDRGTIGAGRRLANAATGSVRMYRAHAAREDTIVFPAWKKLHSKSELDEIAEMFEDVEARTFGGDGFDQAVKKVAGIERSLGIDDLARFTAPPIHA
jgi:hemerythrin superfamily protein